MIEPRTKKPKIAILGAGPTGREAALYARKLGYPVTIYERDTSVASNIRLWDFVQLFTPWRMNVSCLGLEAIRSQGVSNPELDAFPNGDEFTRAYLDPIARLIDPDIEYGSRVIGVSKLGMLKSEDIGGKRRGTVPFRLLIDDDTGERQDTADIVFDATGVYGTPADLGDGGLPAIGERSLRDRVIYGASDVRGADRNRFAGKRTLIVGSGFSAATSLSDLVDLGSEVTGTTITWARKSTGPSPLPTYTDDPLPLRASLADKSNRLASDPPSCLRTMDGVAVKRIALDADDALRVDFLPVEGGETRSTVVVDNLIANCGFRPDTSLFRELQIHQCYATEGPMNLSAALLAASGGASDCLSQTSPGAKALKNPDPGFFILGHKSYGRRSDFLLKVGREQIRDVFRFLEDDPDLDLYRE